MKHQIKSAVFKGLSLLPENLGDRVYHYLKEQSVSVENDIEVKMRTFLTLNDILKSIDADLTEKNILEIGTGWLPTMPYLFKFIGKCNNIFTYDIKKHCTYKRNLQLNDIFSSKYNVQIGMEPLENNYCLPEGIRYFPSTNIITDPPPTNSVDLIFTLYLLEHVAPDDIYKIHLGSKTYLRQSGLVIHFISPSDHRAYSDDSLSLYDFLKYSEKEWDKIQTRFDYHNRLRLPQYIQMFEKTGFDIVVKQYSSAIDNKSELEKLRQFQVHQDFQRFTLDENTAGSLIFILKQKRDCSSN